MPETADNILDVIGQMEADKENGIPVLLKPILSFELDVENINHGDVLKFRFTDAETYQYGIVVAVDSNTLTLRTKTRDYTVSASLLTDSIEVSQHLRGE